MFWKILSILQSVSSLTLFKISFPFCCFSSIKCFIFNPFNPNHIFKIQLKHQNLLSLERLSLLCKEFWPYLSDTTNLTMRIKGASFNETNLCENPIPLGSHFSTHSTGTHYQQPRLALNSITAPRQAPSQTQSCRTVKATLRPSQKQNRQNAGSPYLLLLKSHLLEDYSVCVCGTCGCQRTP